MHDKYPYFSFHTQVGQEPEELIAQDGVVFVLVIELQDLHKVMDATGVLGLLGLFEDGIEVIDDHDLLALLGLTSQLVNGGQGGVQVACAQKVANVEAVHFAVALEVIDVEGEADFFIKVNSQFVKQCLAFMSASRSGFAGR